MLVTAQAQLLAGSTISALEEMRNSKPVIGCFGGVFQNTVYLQEFQHALAERASIFGMPMIPQGVALNGIFRLLLTTELVCQVRTTTMLPLSDSTPDLPKHCSRSVTIPWA